MQTRKVLGVSDGGDVAAAAPVLFERLVGWKELAKEIEVDGLDFAVFGASAIVTHMRYTPQASPTAKQISTAFSLSCLSLVPELKH